MTPKADGKPKRGGHSTKKVPAALKKLRGTANMTLMRRQYDPAGEPDLSGEPPAALDDIGQETWRHAVTYTPPGFLKEADREVLTAWCQNYSRYRAAIATGDIITQFNCEAMLLKMSDKLGFNPTARSRVRIIPPPPTGPMLEARVVNPWETVDAPAP